MLNTEATHNSLTQNTTHDHQHSPTMWSETTMYKIWAGAKFLWCQVEQGMSWFIATSG